MLPLPTPTPKRSRKGGAAAKNAAAAAATAAATSALRQPTYGKYIILSVRATHVYSLEEIVEVGAVVVDAVTFNILQTFQSVVRPSVLPCLSKATEEKHSYTYMDLEINFATVLRMFLLDLAAHFDTSLFVCVGNHHLAKYLLGQILLEQSVSREFPMDLWEQRKAHFTQFCNLNDVMAKLQRQRGHEGMRRGLEHYNDIHYLLSSFQHAYDREEAKKWRCVDKAAAIIPIIKSLTEALGSPLMPTMRMSASGHAAESILP